MRTSKTCLVAHVAREQSPRGTERLRFARFIHVGVAGAAFALTGCATTQHYVPTYCLTQQQFDELKAKEPGKIHDQLNGQADHDLLPIAGSNIRLRAYADGVLTVLGGCIAPNK